MTFTRLRLLFPALSVLLSAFASTSCAYHNLADYEADLVAYHNTSYLGDIADVTQEATHYVVSRAATRDHHLAVVFDIDETALSDWKEITEVVHFGYNDDLFNVWALKEESVPIVPVRDLFNRAKAAGLTLFFVSGRPEKIRQATEENLHKAGYFGWKALYLRPDGYHAPAGSLSHTSPFKIDCRKSIEAHGYVIIANVGDQKSDLVGGYAERDFKIPNPYYRIP